MRQEVDLFSVKVYRNFYSNVEELKRTLLPALTPIFEDVNENNNVFMRNGTVCSYHTSSDIHLRYPEQTREVIEFVENAAKDYWISSGYHKDLEPFVFQLWANKTPAGGYIDSHLHGNMPFTGVLYLDASPAQGNIIIENPLEMILMTQPIGPDVKYPMGQELEVNTGDLIMFPGYIRHSVKPNTTDRDRLILGFNIGCRGNYWTSQWTNNNV
jgi:uncharacterized protein (TIGR02466 family)